MRYSWSQLSRGGTDGKEFFTDYNTNPENGIIDLEQYEKDKVKVIYLNCEYCEKETIVVRDKHKNGWIPYLGNQAQITQNYKYSNILNAIKSYHIAEGWDKLPFTQESGNNIANIHARIHSKDWSYRGNSKSIRLLCNNCFKKTYNRWRVLVYKNGSPHRIDAISVVPENGETLESILQEFGIKDYRILGKGAKFDWYKPGDEN